jgi:hypothetical protein
MDPKGADMKTARLDYADQAAPDFAFTVSQENALLFLLAIDETQGLSLEDAAREDAFEDRL